jgi:predicted Zn finger-like uncharacterized protein
LKFLCDRCKTRYSIGDDRVRGKILKIRCKNCANVITVREGMGDPDGPDVGARPGRPTTGSPPLSSSAPANALGAAFAKQMTKPPPALEEEWYVSIEGEQSGPFSLGDAQRWIAAKPFDADLHCWSEGFDDWLPVDKVSHFRGLRKRPQSPSAPPPVPRSLPAPMSRSSNSGRAIAAAPAPAAAPPQVEDEPKPLFAATMAALERGVAEKSAPARANGSGTLAALPMPSVQNKSASGPMPSIQNKSSSGPLPSITAKAGAGAAKMSALGSARTAPGVGAVSPGAKALAEAFDINPSDSATSVEAQAFSDEMSTSAEPVASRRADDRADAATTMPKVQAAPIMGEDDMEIGEVSRVVKLADIAKMGAPRKPKITGRTTGSVPKIPIGELGLAAQAPMAAFGGTASLGALAEPIPSESVVAAAPLQAHRRGMMILLGAAALLLAGVVIAVVMITQDDGEATSTTLGHAMQVDTNRPDDELPPPRNPIEAVQQTAQRATPKQPIKKTQQIRVPTVTEQETPGDPLKMKIKPEEIEDIANKNSDGTKRCYLRAQKGALGIDIADLKRIDVLFNVDPTGTVTSVSLSDHANDQFGQCLIGRVKSWKFRASPGGQFKLPMVFGS